MLKRLFLLVALVAPWTANATSVVAMPPADQAEEATAIVDAVVGDAVQVTAEDGRDYTDTTLKVREVVAGSAPTEVAIRQMKGSRPDGSAFFVIGDAELEKGQHVVAIVRQVDGRWFLTALGQSVWHVGADGTVDRDMDGLELYERTVHGVVPAIESPRDPETLPALLDELRQLQCGEVAR